MPVLGDFIKIVGDSDKVVGDGNQPRRFEFRTAGRHAGGTAYIIMMVRGMTVTNNDAEVHLNHKNVGTIFNNNGGDKKIWQTQIVHFNGSDLNSGDNELELTGVTYPGGGDDHFDDYFVRNVICHFHQNA